MRVACCDALKLTRVLCTLHCTAGPAFVPVGRDCLVLKAAREFHIGCLAVALAASLYQRTVAAIPTKWQMVGPAQAKWDGFLESAVCPDSVCRFMVESVCKPLVFEARVRSGEDLWPTVVYAACLHMAVKALHRPQVPPKRLGAYSFGKILMHVCNVKLHANDVRHIESWILRRLDHHVVPLPKPPPKRRSLAVGTPDGTPNNVKMVE